MPKNPADEKALLSKEKTHSQSFRNRCACENFDNRKTMFNIKDVKMSNPSTDKRADLPHTRLFTPASARTPLAKSLAHRKLRKYASETCFTLDDNICTDLIPKESSDVITTIGKHKVFSVRPVKNIASTTITRDGAVPGYQSNKRDESEGEASCSGSDATVASTSMTPILRHKSRRFRLNRPKSATQMCTTPLSSDAYNTLTSATVRSIDSLQQIGISVIGGNDERRDSNAYNLDDDSLHEFDDEKGNFFV